jgi:thymidylate synthase ThyX
VSIPETSDPWGDRLSDQDRATLRPFVTNLDGPIFGLRNLPEVVKGALFSRYSRSDKSLRRILLDEFLNAPEAGLAALAGDRTADQLVAVRRAEAFYERVLVGYGDDSVAELGGAHVACEGISNIAAKVLEDSRIGLSPLEKSTRYVVFNRKVDGRYRYLREPAIMASPYAGGYQAALDGLFDTYSRLIDPALQYVRETTPRDAATSERAYASATRAKAYDLLRGLLPMATLTNVGLFGNGRAFEHLLNRLYASDLGELQALAGALQQTLDDLIPSFVKRPKSERGRAGQAYRRTTHAQVAGLVRQISADIAPSVQLDPAPITEHGITLVSWDEDAELRVAAAILYANSELALAEARALAESLPANQIEALFRAYVGERQSRFNRPGRAFEEARYTFDLVADIGAYRDLQRHRMLTQERQQFGVDHGFVAPPELEDAGLAETFSRALEQVAEYATLLKSTLPEQAQYMVPMAFRTRWRITLNLRELFHLAELRSAPQGHPTYRRVAQAMYTLVLRTHPQLAEGMRFVDMGNYALERLAAEQRLDAKMRQLST